jgi:hypothetical protein
MLNTASGAGSAKFSRGHTWKRHLRIEGICRLECQTVNGAHLSREEIALAMGISPVTLDFIRKTPEYHAKMIEVSTGQISHVDKQLRDIADNQRLELEAMVPQALLNLRTAMLSRNEVVKMKATMEVLDREGTLAKVSKMSVTHEVKPDLTGINATASTIMGLLNQRTIVVKDDGSVDSVQTAAESLINSFTVSASDASAQVREMNDAIDASTLENIDMSDKAVQ